MMVTGACTDGREEVRGRKRKKDKENIERVMETKKDKKLERLTE